MLIAYAYRNCSISRQALSRLTANRIAFSERPIREQPPIAGELEKVLTAVVGFKPDEWQVAGL